MTRFSFRPRSLTGLILLGFVIVALPALLGTISAAIEMRNLSAASERLVVNGVAATQYTQAVVRQVSSLERTVRLYQIIPRPALLESFLQNRDLLQKTLQDFSKLPSGNDERARVVASMLTTIDTITEAVRSQSQTRIRRTLREFTALSRDAGQLSNLASAQTDRELKQLQSETEDVRRRLYLQSLALVPLTLGLIVMFAIFLARPIRQIDAAIGAIGHGQLNEPVEVQGPSDLKKLGRQLEWLRVRLQEIAEERNRFLRHMSHELKTPLANIREGTELLMEGAVGTLSSEQREVAGILRDNSLRLQRLIENLLSYSEWQAKRSELETGEIRLLPLMKAAIETYQLPINAHGLRLDLQVPDLTLHADREKLKLILDNLISNAVKFTPDGGTITLRAVYDDAGTHLVLDVADTGPGIPVDERPRIFEAFYQGATPQGGLVRGTGIGLSVVQEFVHAHGGTIELVDGEFPGAHFRVRLPLTPSPTAGGRGSG
ncbi:MAG: ATP-binding protein [Gammaproteobacteria bacterium]|nr:ATP-binding protein [Gammaproteobacteria bacterium]MDH5176254.1 ATP-binding protein [Gammaproteobacteria bacterium]MDH5227576.1 ATP-binding protein [Gammaproteobacteria bacterium]